MEQQIFTMLIVLTSVIVVLTTISIIILILIIKNKGISNSTEQNNEFLKKELFRELSELRITLMNNDNQNNNQLQRDLNDIINSRIAVIDTKVESSLRESIESKNKVNQDITQKLNELEKHNSESYKILSASLVEQINSRLDVIDNKVDQKLSLGFETTNKTFIQVSEKMARIDEAQKNIEKLGSEVLSVKDILSGNKTRGTFGETQLYHVLSNVYGENSLLYEKQYRLPYSVTYKSVKIEHPTPDAVFKCEEPLGLVCIDAKFPLDNFKRIFEGESDEIKKKAKNDFRSDVNNKIEEVRTKYIYKGVTADLALIFIPSEAVFSEINNSYPEIIDRANKNGVWFTGPSTLIAVLILLQSFNQRAVLNRSAKIIKDALNELSTQFKNFKERWDKLSAHIKTLGKDADNLDITSKKITSRFEKIETTNSDLIDHDKENNDEVN
jgi:DNA recombination protein RmuC